MHSYTLICYKSFSTGNWLGLRSLKSRDGISGKTEMVCDLKILYAGCPQMFKCNAKGLIDYIQNILGFFPPWSSYRDFFYIQNVFLSFSGVHYLSSCWTVNVPDSRQENSTKSWLIVCTGISTLLHSFSSWKTLKYATGFVTFNNPKAAYILSLSLYSYYSYLSCVW